MSFNRIDEAKNNMIISLSRDGCFLICKQRIGRTRMGAYIFPSSQIKEILEGKQKFIVRPKAHDKYFDGD